jgi:putative transposase
MKPRFTDEQIIQMIKEQEAGEKTTDVCRRYGISQDTFYKFKSKYDGMEPSDAKKPQGA